MKNQDVSKKLVKGGMIGIGAYFLLKPVNFVTSVLLARYLGANEFGLYSLGLSIIIVLNTFTNVGLPQGIVRFASIYRIEKKFQKVKGVFFSSNFISLVIGFATCSVIIIYADEISYFFLQNKSLSLVLIVLSLGLPFNTLYVFMGSMAQAYKRIDYQNLIVNVARPLSYFLLLLLVLFLHLKLDGFLYANTISTVLVSLFGLWLLFKFFPQIKNLSIKPEYEIKKLMSFSLPTLFTGFTAMLLLRIDRIMIGFFSTESSVGIYNASANAAINIAFFLTPFAAIFAPMAAELFHLEKKDELKKAFQDVSRWLLIFTLPIFFIFVAYSKEILMIFGDEFTIGSSVLIIISFAQLLNVFTGPVGVILKMTGHQNIDMSISFLVLITNILLNLLLIPRYDIIGAAISTALSIGLTNFLRMIMVFRLHKMWPYSKYTLKPLIVFALVFLIFYFLVNTFAFSFQYKVLIGLVSLSTYFLFIFLFKLESTDVYILNVLKQKFLFFCKKKDTSN